MLTRPRKNRYLVAGLLFFFTSISFGTFDINKIPDGYNPGRPTAPYGAYNTPFEGKARNFSDLLDKLEPKVYGLPQYNPKNDLAQAEAAYHLEHLVMGLIQQIGETQTTEISSFEKESLLFRASQLYQHVRTEGERLYELMIRKVDVSLPGPNGAQLRYEDKATGNVIYFSNCRSEKCPSAKEQKEFYDKKLQEFLANGGKLTDMQKLTPELAKTFRGTTRVEYVQRPNGEVWITEGNAGHALLAQGGPVMSAGQIVFVSNQRGEIEFMVVSNASGTYKPDLFSARALSDELARRFNLPASAVITTEGEPLGSQTVKVLMKAGLVDHHVIKTRIQDLEREGYQLLHNPKVDIADPTCKSVMAKINSRR